MMVGDIGQVKVTNSTRYIHVYTYIVCERRTLHCTPCMNVSMYIIHTLSLYIIYILCVRDRCNLCSIVYGFLMSVNGFILWMFAYIDVLVICRYDGEEGTLTYMNQGTTTTSSLATPLIDSTGLIGQAPPTTSTTSFDVNLTTAEEDRQLIETRLKVSHSLLIRLLDFCVVY